MQIPNNIKWITVREFKHKDELLSSINSSTETNVSENTDGLLTNIAHMMAIYPRRVKNLQRYNGIHPKELAADITTFIDVCSTPGAKIAAIYGIEVTPNVIYSVCIFEHPHKIVSWKSYDKRKTSDDEWNRIWGEDSA